MAFAEDRRQFWLDGGIFSYAGRPKRDTIFHGRLILANLAILFGEFSVIELRCPGCRRDLSLPDAVAGKTVRCAHCRQILQVPAPARPPRETRLRNAPNTAAAVPIVRPIAPEPPRMPREPGAPPRRRGSALIALFVMGFVGLLLFAVVGLIGAGVWYYVDGGGGQNQQANGSTSTTTFGPVPDEPANPNPGELSPRALDRLKNLTVFVKADFPGGQSQGSGFLVRVENRIGYVVTNDHVVRGNPDVDQLDRPGRPARPGSRILPRRTVVVFNSGTPQERTAACQIVANDDRRDLAILRITDSIALPEPIDLSRPAELRETLPVFVLGFPFGQDLGHGRNPAITVGKSSVSSLRYDRSNRLSRIQVQGGLNHGNSGGPVVDARGRLVGVAVSGLEGTEIGFIIPPQDVLDMLHAKDYQIRVLTVRSNSAEAELEFQVELLDLVEGVNEVKVLYLTGQGLPPEAMQSVNGRFPILPNSRELILSLDRGKYIGRLKIRSNEAHQNQLAYQVVYTTRGGVTLCNAPKNYHVSFGSVAMAPPVNQNSNPPVNPNPPANTNPPADPNSKPSRPPISRPPRVRPSPPQEPAQEPPISPPPPWVPPETTVAFEAPVTKVAVGGAGRFFVMHFATLHKLSIFDVKQKKFVKTMTVDDDQVMFAAGKSLLILALPKSGVFERWNLNTLQREAEVPSPGIGGIKALVMGNAADDVLLTFVPGGTPNMGVQLIDPKTFRASPYQIDPIPNQFFGLKYSPEFTCVSMSANAQTIVVHGQFTWSSLVRDGMKYRAFTFGAEMPLPSPDGKLIITHGQALSAEGKPITQKRGGHGKAVWCIPAIQGDYYVSFNEVKVGANPSYIKMMIHKGSDVEPVATLPKNESMVELVDWFFGRPKQFERHVFVLPQDKLLVYIPPKNDRIDLFALSISK